MGREGREREWVEESVKSGKIVWNKGQGDVGHIERRSPSPTAFNLLFLLLDRAQHSRIGQVQWFADLLVDLDPKNNIEREREKEREVNNCG